MGGGRACERAQILHRGTQSGRNEGNRVKHSVLPHGRYKTAFALRRDGPSTDLVPAEWCARRAHQDAEHAHVICEAGARWLRIEPIVSVEASLRGIDRRPETGNWSIFDFPPWGFRMAIWNLATRSDVESWADAIPPSKFSLMSFCKPPSTTTAL